MEDGLLIGRIPIKAKLIGKFTAAIGKLMLYPGLRCTRKGTVYEYLIEDHGQDRKFTISFSANEVVMTICATVSPQYHMQDALLRMLGILAFMTDHYEVQLKDIYPYLISVIGSHKLGYIFDKVEKVCSKKNDTDIILARRINALVAGNRVLESEINKLRIKATFVLSNYIIAKHSDKVDVMALAKDTGFSDKEIMESIQHIENLGYKKLRLKDGSYSLLRI